MDQGKPEHIDSGLVCLVMLSRLHDMPADPGQLKHHYGQSENLFTDSEILRGAKSLGLKARSISSNLEKLSKTQLPAIAQHQDGHYFILAQAAEDKVLIQDPLNQSPESLSIDEFQERWNGQFILITTRAGLFGEIRKFDFSWFIPGILKYKKLLAEVLLASFFIQIFALITPLFFQVVIDKVLVHRGLTTLDVLA
ncbi:MAG: subfamily B ATP-binding cassette protein HlyB/CyaB, partial [Gammaproteobacteria bacterium]